MSVVSATCYELLGVPVDAPRRDLARAWADRRRALLTEPQSYGEEEVEALCARLDEAFTILSDPEMSRRYRAYMAQRKGAPAAIRPDDMLHPIVAEWSARSTQIPAPAAPAPEAGGEEGLSVPPPWLGRAVPEDELPVAALVEDAVEAFAGPRTGDLPGYGEDEELDDEPSADFVPDEATQRVTPVEPPVAAEVPEEDSVDTFDEWGDPLDPSERARTVPMAPAFSPPSSYSLRALGSLTTGRPVRSARPLKTMPATSLPKAPWGEDEGESE